MYLYK